MKSAKKTLVRLWKLFWKDEYNINIKTFLIQTIDDNVVHDFSFTLIEKVKFINWFRNNEIYDYCFVETLSDDGLENLIPVGSVEFVMDYYKLYHGIDNLLPINIPIELMKYEYLKRLVMFGSNKDMFKPKEKYFIKDNTKIKGITDIVSYDKLPNNDDWIISELIDIESEWRGFVFNGELLDIRCYVGEFDMFPNVDQVREMIGKYKNSPRAYTIDVGVNNDKGTFLIECHQFFSCGLYGFNHHSIPLMFSSCHKEIVKGERYGTRDKI